MTIGFLWAFVMLGAVGVFSFTSGWRMQIDERQALVAAQGAVEFAVGHASAQQVWRGLRSRPTWRVLIYSAEEPPRRRGLVLVDAVNGRVRRHHLLRHRWPDHLGSRQPRAQLGVDGGTARGADGHCLHRP